MKLVPIAIVLLAACPSKQSKLERTIATIDELATSMCACVEKACAERVQATMTARWQELTKTESERKPTADQTERMTAAMQRYSACMDKAMRVEVVPPEARKRPQRTELPPPAMLADADTLIASARAWASVRHPEQLLASVTLYYVDANGMLDGEHGELYAVFGRPARDDDPERKTGAPLRTKRRDCVGVTWARGRGWMKSEEACVQVHEAGIRCSVREVWKRAIANNALTDALATIQLAMKPDERTWGFWIKDEPRGVDIHHAFYDDCEMAVEK